MEYRKATSREFIQKRNDIFTDFRSHTFKGILCDLFLLPSVQIFNLILSFKSYISAKLYLKLTLIKLINIQVFKENHLPLYPWPCLIHHPSFIIILCILECGACPQQQLIRTLLTNVLAIIQKFLYLKFYIIFLYNHNFAIIQVLSEQYTQINTLDRFSFLVVEKFLAVPTLHKKL